jgi:hypothetical protein
LAAALSGLQQQLGGRWSSSFGQGELTKSGLFLPGAQEGWTISKEWENAIMTTGGDDGSFADDVREAEIPLFAVDGDDGTEDGGVSYLEVIESAKRVAGAGAGRVLP